ncbi:hypothetical protein, partial [Klebsiella pneumoniae]|uniref:hypothetical protein n=1 Tax=Klebsiella pneumoniae TaxID=573 RepID=UPI002AE0922A
YTEALDIVAREMGYRDYRQAQQALASSEGFSEVNQTGYPVFLCAYWRNTDTTPRSAGCETLKVYLPRPMNNFVSKHQAT